MRAAAAGQVEAVWGDAGQGLKESARGLLTENWGGQGCGIRPRAREPAAGPRSTGGT